MGRIKFGTDGWRAVISEDFTYENVEIVAQAVADYVKKQKVKTKNRKSELYGKKYALVVGYDTRFLSEKYAELVSCVFAANGIKTILGNTASPTPSVSHAIRRKNFIGGIMITASHNPSRYNGIKYKGYFGGSAGKKVTDAIESRLYKSKVQFIDRAIAIKKGLIKVEDIVSPHLKGVEKYADMTLLSKAGLKILVDSMNGTGARYIEWLLRNTNNKIITINGERDALFGGRPPEPNEQHMASTAKILKKGHFDLALVTDGDADRLGVVSPNGKILSGHKVMTLLLLHLLEGRNETGGVVQTICGTGLIDKIAGNYGLKTYETAVGFKYIAEIYNKEDILVGGEETGGVAFKGWMPERDSLLSGLLILEMIAHRKKSLKKILDDVNKTYGVYVYKRFDVRYSVDKKKKLLSILHKKPFKKVLGKGIVSVKSFDGVKFIRSDGSWVMLRPSGTEPKLRVYSEGHSEKEAIALLEFGKRFALSI
ncbi:MAG: phosphoglucomutase/phosphomannomutase family protein [Candidatus Omnitrophica bacterium]|nr:phosphoglucomutase/phosphomannomutase family protein [Candidatus Omnitrophota bacterium]